MGTLHCFEHQGRIAITGRDGDICIPGLGYAISIEGGELEVFGDTAAGNLFLNRKGLGGRFPHFTRSPRLILHAPDKKVEISHPPARASMPKGSLIQMILPPVVMLCITIVIAIVMNRGIFVLMFIASTIMTLAFSISGYVNNKKECREKNRAREELYREYLLRKRKELNALHREEETWHYNYPDAADIEKMIRSCSSRIYERSPEDDDFLEVSLGKCREKASFSVSYQDDELKMEEDELERQAKLLEERFAYIDDKAVTVSLRNAHLGLVGGGRPSWNSYS